MIEHAVKWGKPVRIGVNWGSLDQDLLARLMDENRALPEPRAAQQVLREALVVSALGSAQRAEELGLPGDRIILSCKVSDVQDLIAVYTRARARCDYPLHLGLTEAGMGSKGIVASTAAMAVLLQSGIGDTIRVSLTPEPGGDRTREVIVAQEILQTMGLRSFTPLVTACPGCGRTTSTYFQELADKIQCYLRAQMPEWRTHYTGVEAMSVAVMGCVVNGPGESRTPTSASACRARAKCPSRRSTSMGERPSRSRANTSPRNSSRSSPITCAHRTRAGGGLVTISPRRALQALRGRSGSARARKRSKAAGKLARRLEARARIAQSRAARVRFRDFYRTMSFVNALAHIANIEDHHPDLEVGYNYCRVKFTTHAIKGLSENDFICAAKIDRIPVA